MSLPAQVPVLVVGAGPIGLAVAIAARRRGLAPLVVDAGVIVNSIARYPVGMTFFTTAERLEIGGHPFPSHSHRPTREEALAYYRGVVRVEGLDVRTGWQFTGAARTAEGFGASLRRRGRECVVRTDQIILATGYFDHPNLLGVPGESLSHVSHWFEEPHRTSGQRVVIVGGKNSAIEAALLAWRAGAAVTLVHRSLTLRPTVKYWLRPDFENRVAAGEITAHLGWQVTAIDDAQVTIRDGSGRTASLPADRVYLLTGYHPDFDLLRRLGVDLDADGRAMVSPETRESNVPGLYLAGSVAAGMATGEVFIENGRFDGEKIFGSADERERADALYDAQSRPTGE